VSYMSRRILFSGAKYLLPTLLGEKSFVGNGAQSDQNRCYSVENARSHFIGTSWLAVIFISQASTRFINRLVNSQNPQEIVFKGKQVQQHRVSPPPQSTDNRPRHSVENEMIRGRNNGNQDQRGVQKSQDHTQ
jgi:hypothetical protein